jgi:hypothetical protein
MRIAGRSQCRRKRTMRYRGCMFSSGYIGENIGN